MWLPMLADNACMNMDKEVSVHDCVPLVIMNIINLKGKNLPWLRACFPTPKEALDLRLLECKFSSLGLGVEGEASPALPPPPCSTYICVCHILT